jgi:hypothetical protein
MAEKKTKAQRRQLADLIGKGMPVGEAMLQAGWSEKSADKGWAKVPKTVLKMIPAERLKLLRCK